MTFLLIFSSKRENWLIIRLAQRATFYFYNEKSVFSKESVLNKYKQLLEHSDPNTVLWALVFLLGNDLMSIEEAKAMLVEPRFEYPKQIPIITEIMRECIMETYSANFVAPMDPRFILEGLVTGTSFVKRYFLNKRLFKRFYFSRKNTTST